MKSKTVQYWPHLLIVLLACCFVLLPLFKEGFIITDDGNWMVIRLSAFYQSLREGQFPVRFIGRLNYSYGYPVSNFLYPGFLYLGSLLHAIGFSFVDAIKIIFSSSVILGSLSIFFWLKRHGSEVAATIGTLSFVLSPYLLFDIYKRGSVGEVLAIGVSALCIYLVDSKRFFWISPAIAFLLISHNSVALISFVFIGVIVTLQKDYRGLLAWFLGLGMATLFWFPALYEKRLVIFDNTLVADPSQYFLSKNTLNLLGLTSIISFIWIVFTKPKKINLIYIMGFVILLLLSTKISTPIWNLTIFSQVFQFPYRMLSLKIILGSYLVSLMINRSSLKIRKILICLCFFVIILQSISFIKNIVYSNQPEGYYSTNEATTTVANEYMPFWVTEKKTERPTVRMAFQFGRGSINFIKANTQRIEAKVEAIEDSILQINSIYYPGWGVLVNDLPVNLAYDNPNGLIRFKIPKGNHTVVAEFRETVERFVADIISVVFIFIWIIYFTIDYMRRNKKLKIVHIHKKNR